MTRHIDVAGIRLVTIAAEKVRGCQACGKVAETRPYGEGGMRICFACAMKDESETERQFAARLGEPK